MRSASRPTADERYPKSARLRKRPEYQAVQRSRAKVHTKHFLLLLRVNTSGDRRLGITVTKKVGNAVERNRVKRCVREVFRRHPELFPAGMDVVFIAKRGAPALGSRDVRGQVERAQKNLSDAAQRARGRL